METMYKCNKCGTIYTSEKNSKPDCCVIPMKYRTSGICGGELKELTTREQAMDWWFLLTLEERFYKVIPWLKSKELNTASRHPDSLTDREIEEIWKKETQTIERGITINNVESKVDFELLNWSIAVIKDNIVFTNDKANNNFQLFFKLLAEKPTFAQLAHKELNKLNN